MSGETDDHLTVYHCLECGPVLRDVISEDRHVTWHKPIPHPFTNMEQAEENLPVQ